MSELVSRAAVAAFGGAIEGAGTVTLTMGPAE